jgi:hypothetical protein
VHAGGEQGWKSDHLEPFSLWGMLQLAQLALVQLTAAQAPKAPPA